MSFRGNCNITNFIKWESFCVMMMAHTNRARSFRLVVKNVASNHTFPLLWLQFPKSSDIWWACDNATADSVNSLQKQNIDVKHINQFILWPVCLYVNGRNIRGRLLKLCVFRAYGRRFCECLWPCPIKCNARLFPFVHWLLFTSENIILKKSFLWYLCALRLPIRCRFSEF